MDTQKRGIALRSADTDWLVKRLMKVPTGETLSYDDLSKELGRNVRDEAYSCLQSARHIVERQEHRLFDVIRGVALKRVDDLGGLRIVGRDQKHIARTARRGVRRLGTCVDRDQLPNNDRQSYDLSAATLGMVAHVTRPQTQKKLAARVTASMPTTKALEALRDVL
jgi:hypothetical protein